jgi:GAF domain-containing protein
MSQPDPVQQACESAGRLAQAGAPREEVLACLARAAEVVSGPRSTVSILVLDEGGLLRNGASPRLPADYLDAIDGLKPDAGVGTCAAAAATGRVVMTPDFRADASWAELRHLPLALGYVAAWSMPITDQGKVLGTFGTYFRDLREPSDTERDAVAKLAAAAASVLKR